MLGFKYGVDQPGLDACGMTMTGVESCVTV
jgi:hypothetical protein